MNNYSIIESLKGYYRDRHITMKTMNAGYSRHVIVRVLEAWPNDQLCPDLSDFHQLWPDLWPKVAGSMAK